MLLVHENAPQFDEKLLQDALPNYGCMSVVFDPEKPYGVHRSRRYTLMWDRDRVEFHGNEADFLQHWQEEAALCGQLNCDSYFTASSELQQAYKRVLAKRHMPATDSWRELLAAGAVLRLYSYEKLYLQEAQKKGWAEDQPFVFDLSQNPSAVKRCGISLPTLLRNSTFWSRKLQRMCLPEEALLMQGLPVPGLVEGATGMTLPFDVDLLSAHEKRQVAGNMMFMPALGSFLLYVLSHVCLACLLRSKM